MTDEKSVDGAKGSPIQDAQLKQQEQEDFFERLYNFHTGHGEKPPELDQMEKGESGLPPESTIPEEKQEEETPEKPEQGQKQETQQGEAEEIQATEEQEQDASTGPPEFHFDETKNYPIPTKDGPRWVPFQVLRRYIEKGVGADKLIQRYKQLEKDVAVPRAIYESMQEVPEAVRSELFDKIRDLVRETRKKSGLTEEFVPKVREKPEPQEAVLPERYQKLLDEFEVDRERRAALELDEAVRGRARQQATELVEFAQKEYGITIDKPTADRLRSEAKKFAAQNGLKLYQVDLISVFARMNPGKISAARANKAEADGRVKKTKSPPVAPRSGPVPKTPPTKKYTEMSDDEVAALPDDERKKAFSERMVRLFGR